MESQVPGQAIQDHVGSEPAERQKDNLLFFSFKCVTIFLKACNLKFDSIHLFIFIYYLFLMLRNSQPLLFIWNFETH